MLRVAFVLKINSINSAVLTEHRIVTDSNTPGIYHTIHKHNVVKTHMDNFVIK